MSTTRAIIIGLFLAGVAGLALLTVVAHRERSRISPFSELAGFVMAFEVSKVPIGRVAVLGFWWWAGWHFFAR